MAQRVEIQLVDDIDGSRAEETVTFALDGVQYEIDLTTEHADELREALADWITHARRTGGRRSTRPVAGAGPDNAAVREWATSQGLPVSSRGRISAEIRDAYVAAQAS